MKRIQIFFEDIPSLKINKSNLNSFIIKLILNELKEMGDISVILCTDDYLLNINKQYLSHDYYTDIVTFDYGEKSVISGDLFISVDRVKENAALYNTSFPKELLRIIFHGILHLVGYNDKTELERTEMRQKEDYYLKGIDFRRILL